MTEIIHYIPENKRRNLLVVQLRNRGLTLDQIANDKEVIRLSGRILTRQRISIILKNRAKKGGDR